MQRAAACVGPWARAKPVNREARPMQANGDLKNELARGLGMLEYGAGTVEQSGSEARKINEVLKTRACVARLLIDSIPP